MKKQLSKKVLAAALSIMLLSMSVPVCAASCNYSFDPSAIGYGNVNKNDNVMVYSEYVLGSLAPAYAGIAKYTVKKGSNTYINKANMTTTGQVSPGVQTSINRNYTAYIYLYHGNTQVASTYDN